MPVYYRFECGGLGIYEAVERDCPRGDLRRSVKPDGSWLPRVGKRFPGAVSYWSEAGLERYIRSGLQDWHRAVVRESPTVRVSRIPGPGFHEDEFQVIARASDFEALETLSSNAFFERLGGGSIVSKVAAFVTRVRKGRAELLVFRHTDFPELGIQVPAGTLEPGEDPAFGAARELFEESGMDLPPSRAIGEFVFFKNYSSQYQRRHVIHFSASVDVANAWEHRVRSSGEDGGLRFRFEWQALDALDPNLIRLEGLGNSIGILRDILRDFV